MKSLRTKTAAAIVVVVLVSSGLLSLIGYERARTSMSAQLEKNYSVTAEKYALELTAWVNTNATIVETMAADIAVSGIYDDVYAGFHRYLQESNRRLNKDGVIFDIYFTYPDNSMVCASDFIPDGSLDYAHEREWFTEAARTHELFCSAPYLDSDSGLPIITISKAVYTGSELQGVLAADIFVDMLVGIISDADVAPGSYAFLVDQEMRMVVHPNEAYAYNDEPLGVMDVPDAPYAEVIENMKSGSRETVYLRDYDGVTRGVVVSRMPNTGWYVGIATDREELLKDVSGLMRGFLIAAGIAILIGGIIAVFSAHALDDFRIKQQKYEEEVLRLEKQAADDASNAKSRFLADMSHEIRTPINAILGMNEMILRESDDKEIRQYAGNIRQSGRNLLQLVNGILDFSKIEDGKMEIVPVRYSVRSQVDYLRNSIEERVRAKSLDLCMNIDPALPSELYGDDMRINQVIMNLLTNAVKYTQKGSVTLAIEGRERISTETGEGILLYVEVRDTGIGIKEKDIARLFESFERLDVEKNRHIEGTGLGMAITKKLLHLMGSELNVESTYGEGSAFSFELWQKVENEEPLGDDIPAETGSEDEYREVFRAPSARILAVDDTKMNLLVIESLLKKTGVQIDSALSGEEAIRFAQENLYDVILMDQRMPEMDGTEAMRAIRAQGKNAKTPIICLTADVVSGARERYLAEGFDDYLTKPVAGLSLEKMLAAHIPEEKIVYETVSQKETQEDAGKTDTELLTVLEEAGVHTSAGLLYCQNDGEMYRSILTQYCAEEETRAEKLQSYFEKQDWKNYEIYMHSLKSISRTLGAEELAKLAASLEKAAISGDGALNYQDHDRAMEMYRHLAAVIREYLDPGAAVTPSEHGVILEFAAERSL